MTGSLLLLLPLQPVPAAGSRSGGAPEAALARPARCARSVVNASSGRSSLLMLRGEGEEMGEAKLSTRKRSVHLSANWSGGHKHPTLSCHPGAAPA